NGRPATVRMLAQLGALLVDLHGQHETQSLLRQDAQRDILDAYGDAAVERVAVRDAYERLRELERRDAELKARREEVQRKADYLRHVIQEIERAQPRVGEDETLETEAKRLAHAEELVRLARELEEALDTAGLALAAKLVAGLERLDPSAGQWRQLLDGAFANVGELAQAARACTALSEKRQRGAARLDRAVNELLPALGLAGGRFAAQLVTLPAPQGSGVESVVFEVQLNVGIEARPLAKVASGGELSRLMLALKVVLAEHDAVPTLVFDEVDQGIGGEVGARV